MSEMDFDAQARMAAQRAEREVAMVDIPEAEAVVGRRRAQHRARTAVAGAVAVLVLGGGVAFAVANAGGGSSKGQVAHEPTTTTTVHDANGPQLPANVLAWLRQYVANLSPQSHADYADWARTTNGDYKFDVHGLFVVYHPCPSNTPPQNCVSTGNDEVFTLDARLSPIDFTVGDPVDLTKLGPVGRVVLGRAQLRIRLVENNAPYSATSCGQVGLVARDNPGEFHDNTKMVCYALGPTIMTGTSIVKAEATGPEGIWQIDVTFRNDDFVNKVAKPYVNQDIAIVVDGVVYSAPKINPGITGRDVTITGQLTEQQAKDLAAALSPRRTFGTSW